MFLSIFLACAGKTPAAGDSADTAPPERFPCDADYFPVDFATRSYDYTEYSGRFAQATGGGVRSLAFQRLLEGAGDTGGALTGCVFNQIVPMGLGGAYTVYGIDADWIYVLGDGDRDAEGEDVYYMYEEPIPLLPLAPEAGWQDFASTDYSHPDFDTPLQAGVDAQVVDTAASLSTAAGSYEDLLAMSWQWTLLDGQERLRLDLDITAYFDVDEGLIRQTWYDALTDSSGLVELQGS